MSQSIRYPLSEPLDTPLPFDQRQNSFKMSSIKQLIINAIIKVSGENPPLNREGEPTAEEARESFIALLMAELFPEHGNETSAVVVPVVEPVPAASPVKKLTKEEKAAAKAAKEAAKAEAKAAREAAAAAKAEAKAAKEAAKAASPKKSPEEKAAEKEAAKAAKEAEKAAAKAAEAEAKAKAKAEADAAKAEAKAAEKAAKAAAKAEAKAAKKAAASPPKADVNVPKIDPTWRKCLKEADKEHAKELEPELLKYLNSIANAVFNDKTAKQHVAEFLASRAPAPAAPMEPIDLEVVEFNGKEYYVNRETKRVYVGVYGEDGELKVTDGVGYVGMAEFKDMELDDE